MDKARIAFSEININDSWISLVDVASYLGGKKENVRSWIKKKGIPAHKIGK